MDNKPTFPVVNDSVITLTVNGESFANNNFTLNQNSNGTIDIPLPSFMRFITSITSYSDLPSATKSRVGNVYKVASEFTYNTNVLAKVGDLFICANPSTNTYEWIRIPSGDENYQRVVAGVDGLCPALPSGNDAGSKFLNGLGNWAVPTDTNTTYTLSYSNGVLTLTPSEGSAQTANIPNDNTTYTISYNNGVLTLTPSVGNAQTINIPNDNTTYTISFSNGVLTLTPSVGNAQTINIPDTKVTSAANHYTPQTDSNSDVVGGMASGTSAGSYSPNTDYDVVTGVKAETDGKGHITGLVVTKQTIKDTDTNNYRAIKINNQTNQTLAANSNADANFANGDNISINENNGTITIGVSATDHYITSGDLTISSGVVSFALTAGHNYFVGTSANVSNLSALTTLNITINAGSNGACESNVFFKAASANFHLNFYDGSNNAVSVKLIGDEPEYETNGEYLLSYYKGTIIFGALSARTNNN